MSKFRLNRVMLDLVFTFLLALLLSFIFMIILDIEIHLEFIKQLIEPIMILAIVIVIVHQLFCISDEFFWKFAFLLPDEVYYYIIAKNKSCSSEDLRINLNDSVLILPRPEAKKNKLDPAIEIGRSYINEAKNIVLLLQKKGDNSPEIKNRYLFEIIESYYGRTCLFKLRELPRYIYLLFYNNAILLLGRSLLLTILFALVLLQNPPIMIAVNPVQIQENLTAGIAHTTMIFVENNGCDLSDVKLQNCVFKENMINVTWEKTNSTDKGEFSSTKYDFIFLNVSANLSPGEYIGSIKITASANRFILPSLPRIDNAPIHGKTFTKRLAEVPFFLRIVPDLNAASWRANGKVQQ